jgi:hypothetical protein
VVPDQLAIRGLAGRDCGERSETERNQEQQTPEFGEARHGGVGFNVIHR